MKVIATQQLLRVKSIDFFDNSQWPGSSPDLNVAENIGTIMKDRTEEALEAFKVNERSKPAILRQTLNTILNDMSDDTELFETLLKLYPHRLAAVKAAKGYHTKILIMLYDYFTVFYASITLKTLFLFYIAISP